MAGTSNDGVHPLARQMVMCLCRRDGELVFDQRVASVIAGIREVPHTQIPLLVHSLATLAYWLETSRGSSATARRVLELAGGAAMRLAPAVSLAPRPPARDGASPLDAPHGRTVGLRGNRSSNG